MFLPAVFTPLPQLLSLDFLQIFSASFPLQVPHHSLSSLLQIWSSLLLSDGSIPFFPWISLSCSPDTRYVKDPLVAGWLFSVCTIDTFEERLATRCEGPLQSRPSEKTAEPAVATGIWRWPRPDSRRCRCMVRNLLSRSWDPAKRNKMLWVRCEVC